MIDAGWFPYRAATTAVENDGIRRRAGPSHSWVGTQPFLVAPSGIPRDCDPHTAGSELAIRYRDEGAAMILPSTGRPRSAAAALRRALTAGVAGANIQPLTRSPIMIDSARALVIQVNPTKAQTTASRRSW